MSRHSSEHGCQAHDFSFILPHNVLSDYWAHIGPNLHVAMEWGVLSQSGVANYTYIAGR
jgi:hypothetical protein